MRFRSLFASAILLLPAGIATACTIPVFRYALDRWEADKFQLVLPPSVARDPQVIDLLRPLRANGHANVRISEAAEAAQAELHFPARDHAAVWTGKLNQVSLSALLDSPMRRKIAEHILKGDSIIWVMADRGSVADEAHAQRLEQRLKFLEQVAALPIQNPHDPDSQLGPGPALKLKFTLLRVRNDDPAESTLVSMLAGPSGKIDSAATSFAAAVFGRGRVLGAWRLDELDDAVLEDASLFLVGRCSCSIKNDNPGWDLLMSVDWESALERMGAGGKDTREATGAVQTAATPVPASVQVAAPHPASPVMHDERFIGVRKPWLMIGAAVLVALLAIALLRGSRLKK